MADSAVTRAGVFDRRDRVVLELLNEHVTLTLADLADELAVARYDAPLSDVDAEDVEAEYFDLYYRIVPRLVRAELVAYDQSADLVARPGYGADADPLHGGSAPRHSGTN